MSTVRFLFTSSLGKHNRISEFNGAGWKAHRLSLCYSWSFSQPLKYVSSIKFIIKTKYYANI